MNISLGPMVFFFIAHDPKMHLDDVWFEDFVNGFTYLVTATGVRALAVRKQSWLLYLNDVIDRHPIGIGYSWRKCSNFV